MNSIIPKQNLCFDIFISFLQIKYVIIKILIIIKALKKSNGISLLNDSKIPQNKFEIIQNKGGARYGS